MRLRSKGADWIAGLSVAGLMLPEGVAYSAIAGLKPIAGLTAAIAGGLAYVVIGRSRFAIVSPTSSAAAILAASLASLHPAGGSLEGTAAALTAMVGLIFLGLAVAHAGSFAGFVSRPVLRGFAFGLAITIIVGQLPHSPVSLCHEGASGKPSRDWPPIQVSFIGPVYFAACRLSQRCSSCGASLQSRLR